MNHVVLILNASLSDKAKQMLKRLTQHCSTQCVLADGASTLITELSLSSAILVGDFDSSDPSAYAQNPALRIVRFPTNKDSTDGVLALEEALQLKPQRLTIAGIDGGRFDMVLANLALLLCPALENIRTDVILSDGQQTHLITPAQPYSDEPYRVDWEARGDLGADNSKSDGTVSLMPLSDIVHVKTFRGVKWPLTDIDIFRNSTLTVSNQLQNQDSESAALECVIDSGRALLFLPG